MKMQTPCSFILHEYLSGGLLSGFVSFKESDLTVVVGVAVVVAMVVVVVRGRVVGVKPDVIVGACVVADSTAVSEAVTQAAAHKSKQKQTGKTCFSMFVCKFSLFLVRFPLYVSTWLPARRDLAESRHETERHDNEHIASELPKRPAR